MSYIYLDFQSCYVREEQGTYSLFINFSLIIKCTHFLFPYFKKVLETQETITGISSEGFTVAEKANYQINT